VSGAARDSGVRLRLEHPLSLGVDLIFLEEQMPNIAERLVQLIEQEPEFALVKAAGKVSTSSAGILRGLRGAIYSQDVTDAIVSVAWLLVEQGFLEESGGQWLASILRPGEQAV
jgi:hypothetical protein